MWLLSRKLFGELTVNTLLGVALFTLVLFLQRLGRLLEVLVRGSAPAQEWAALLAWVLPPTLAFSLPTGVVVGVLLTTTRMSADGEILALRAAGIPARRLLWPVLALGILTTALAMGSTCWLTPLAIRESYALLNRVLARQVTAEIQPRVFEESFPDTILYVGDVVAGPVVRWRRVFLADLRPPEQRAGTEQGASDLPRITLAREARVTRDVENNRIQLSLVSGRTYQPGQDPDRYYVSAFPRSEQVLVARAPRREEARPYTFMETAELWQEARRTGSVEARIELHRRLALPLACVLLAWLGLPLGTRARRPGRSYAFVLTVLIAFGYYTLLISLIGMARQGRVSPELATWTPDGLLLLAVFLSFPHLERPRRWALPGMAPFGERLERLMAQVLARWTPPSLGRLPLLPQIIDRYILSDFLYYFVLLLVGFVVLVHVFTFFELVGDIIRNQVPMKRVLTYHFFLTPKLLYDSAPLSVLVGVLVTFGVLSRHNEVTAFKACGVSVYRLGAPVLMAGFFLSGAMFAFDYYWLPEANRIQDAIRNEIKGRPVQTYLRPDRKWIFGDGPRIYYYRYFDPEQQLMAGISVYELREDRFELRRHIWAERARWEPALGTWVFQNGWVRDFDGIRVTRYEPFLNQVRTFPELHEAPSYFLKEVKQDQQMSFVELREYIRDLQRAGFDTVRLQVRFHEKFARPLFSFVMALVALPFAFTVGPRGAMSGVGIALGVALVYWVTSQLFEQVGYLNQLPAAMAAWAPAMLFAFVGGYLLARVRT